MFSVMAYFWLILGGVFEPVWVLTMKKSKHFKDPKWTLITIFFIILSPFFLSLAMREIPVGTAYAVWTGIGAIGATLLGLVLYKESVEKKRLFFIFLIIAGCVGLALGGN